MRIAWTIGWVVAVMTLASASPAADKKRAQPVVVVTGLSPEPITMGTVNRRWKGSRCQIRFAAEISKGTDGSGWSRSKWTLAPTLPGDRRIYVRLWVSDRAALERGGYLRRRKFTRPGTPFTAIGWGFQDTAKQKNLVLGLRFEQLPVQARLEFRDTKAVDLEDVERLAKVELFQVLGKPPAPRMPTTASPTTPPVAETVQPTRPGSPPLPPVANPPEVPSAETVYRPAVEVLSASVNPAQVSPGSPITLMIHYEVKGLPPGTSFEVVERRVLKLGGRVLTSFEEKLPRASGSYTSTQQIDVSTGMSAGIYSFEAEVTLAGVSAVGTALFEIR